MSPNNWDKVLEDVGLATPATKPVVEPVVEKIAVPVAKPVAPPVTRRAPSFGSGILDDAPEPLRAAEPTPTPDLIADIEATAAKSSSFFDMLPSLNPFSAFSKKPAAVPPKVAPPKTDAPLPERLFTQQSKKQNPVAKTPAPEPRREEPRREHRVERVERVKQTDDPWTDVASQIDGVVDSRRRSERSERPERKRTERKERTERVERIERDAPSPPRPRSESQRSEPKRSEDYGLSWQDAVGVVVSANVARRRKR